MTIILLCYISHNLIFKQFIIKLPRPRFPLQFPFNHTFVLSDVILSSGTPSQGVRVWIVRHFLSPRFCFQAGYWTEDDVILLYHWISFVLVSWIDMRSIYVMSRGRQGLIQEREWKDDSWRSTMLWFVEWYMVINSILCK